MGIYLNYSYKLGINVNQRLIIIVSIILLSIGIIGILFSDTEDTTLASQAPVTSSITFYITKRAMGAGEKITPDDYEEKVEEFVQGTQQPESLQTVDGLYLTESVHGGTTLVPKLLTKEIPKPHSISQNFRFTITLQKKYINNINGLIPGDSVDVYLRFDAPKREHDNKSSIYRGESVVKLVKLFRNKKLLTPVMKSKKTVEEEQKTNFSANGLLENSDDYSVDIELSRSDLKKIYQVDNKYEIIIFPADNSTSEKNNNTVSKKGGKS